MNDPRYDRLAQLITGYSLELQAGQIVRIDGSLAGSPLLVALYGEAVRRGAHAYVNAQVSELAEYLIAEGSEAQLDYVSPVEYQEMETVDALIRIWSDANTRSMTGVDPDRQRRRLAARRELTALFFDRVAKSEVRWCGALSPTNAHAQDAEMSLAEYEDFVFSACHVADEGDAAAHWREVSDELHARARDLSSCSSLRIVGPDTDLTVSPEGRTWLVADGKQNMPDGEVFTSPVEHATEGEIRFSFPALFQGREIEDVRLRFEGGRVVEAEAARGGEYLNSILDVDDEARYLGEVAFGLNYEIDRFTRNILFDEKIGGTMHVALGAGFGKAGGENKSALHWDLICDLREEGEVYADGELVWKAGSFLQTPELEHV